MALSAGSVMVQVGANLRGFNRGMDQVDNRMRGMSRMRGLAKVGVAGAVLGGVAAFKAAINAAADYEASLNTLTVERSNEERARSHARQ